MASARPPAPRSSPSSPPATAAPSSSPPIRPPRCPPSLIPRSGPIPRRCAGRSASTPPTSTPRRPSHRWLEPRRELLAAIALRGTYLDEEDVARLLKLSLPGIDEVIGLLEIRRMSGDDFDEVVVDTAPTGHTLRLLAAPALLGRVAGVLDSLQSHHRAVVSALRGSYRQDGADALDRGPAGGRGGAGVDAARSRRRARSPGSRCPSRWRSKRRPTPSRRSPPRASASRRLIVNRVTLAAAQRL